MVSLIVDLVAGLFISRIAIAITVFVVGVLVATCQSGVLNG